MIRNWNEALEFVAINEPTFLRKAGRIRGEQSYVCPCCSNGAGAHGTGITVNPKSSLSHPTYHCFKCGETFDNIELYREEFGLQDESVVTIVKEMMDFYGEPHPDVFVTTKNHRDASSADEKNDRRPPVASPSLLRARNQASAKFEKLNNDMEYENQEAFFAKCRASLDPTYLQERGLSRKTQEHFWIGTDPEWINPAMLYNAEKEGKPTSELPTSPRCIIPTSKTSYLARDIRKKISKQQQKFAKLKYGPVHLFNIVAAKKAEVVFVVEGEIDAMSVFEASGGKYAAVGLGSTSNVKLLLEKVAAGDFQNTKAFVLMLDRDNAGYKAASELRDGIKDRKGITSIPGLEEQKKIVVPCTYGYGDDPNEALVKNRRVFKLSLDDAYKTAVALFEKQPVHELQAEQDADHEP